MKIILKLVAGMLAGVLIGLYGPGWGIKGMLTISQAIGELIMFTIPLIILFYITSGIASLPRDSGRLLGRTIALAYASTLTAGALAFVFATIALPRMALGEGQPGQESEILSAYFTLKIPPLFSVMSALAAAFVFGIGISALRSEALRVFFADGRDIIERFLAKVIIPLLPVFIAGVFTSMAADGSVFQTLQAFGLVLVLVISMHWAWLSALYIVTGLLNGRSPLSLVRTMLPAYFTAVGTMSSAATIPVTLRQVKALGVSEPIANFVVPLCANIHLSGSTITLVTCATAVFAMTPGIGLPSAGTMLPFIVVLGVIMIAAPGAPGGAVMSAIGLFGPMLGFDGTQIALMIALYLAQDSFGTATNVTGDGVIALWIDRFHGRQPEAGSVPQAGG